MIRAAILCLLPATLSAAATTDNFPPLESWKQAVVAGNKAALIALYSTDPRRQLLANKQPVTVEDETAFWGGMHAAGVTEFDPKLLSIEQKQGAEQLILRVTGHLPDGRRFAASLAQFWLNAGGQWVIVASQRSDLVPDAGRALPEPARPNPNLYPPPADAPRELKEARERAAREHKRVLVVFGANWCYDCHVLDTTLRSAKFAPLVNANYVVVHISTGDEGKDNTGIAKQLGVGLEKGIPAVAVLKPDGEVLAAQKNGEFESTTRIGPQDVRAFLEKYKVR